MTLAMLALALTLTLTSACSPPVGWKAKTMDELLAEYDLVVLGTLMDADNFPILVPNAEKTFELFCVLKGDGNPVPRELTIKDPGNPCNFIPKTIGKSFIMGLSRINDTAFSWWKDAGIEAVLWEYRKESLNNATKICTLQNPQQPDSSQPIPNSTHKACPVIPEEYKKACSPRLNSDTPDTRNSYNPLRAEISLLAVVMLAWTSHII